jgi:hypothetical protein
MSDSQEVALTGTLEAPQGPRTLFRTEDPVEVLQAAREVASALGPALRDGGMLQRIGQGEHVKIEGWQTLGAMVGVSAHTIWSRELEDGTGWEARAEARTLDGRIVGTAEAMCTKAERNWARRESHELRSMAQTRAMSKALAAPLRFIVTLSGLSGTPAEEVTAEPYGPAADQREETGPGAGPGRSCTTRRSGISPKFRQRRSRGSRADAGGYLPKIVARAVMLTAARRPDRKEDPGRGGESEGATQHEQDTRPSHGTRPVEAPHDE